MTDFVDSTVQIPTHVSKRNPTACEQCRLARVKCRASEQPSVCERCLTLKRECISRARARPRRWKRKWGTGDSSSSPPLLHPANDTFRINYSVPVKTDLDDNFETLCKIHDRALDGMLLEECPVSSSPIVTQNSTTSATLSNLSHSLSDIWRQPLFNMASAESLLSTFQSMLNYLPFLSFPQDPKDCSISNLSATRPFTLLSILTVTSGLWTTQKHTLYDDEFRKALGLKYVSGGEKSLELLQGLLIYCAWYPFHLRPKNGQLLQYLRMTSGLVHDLQLDENFLEISKLLDRPITNDELEKIRTYLAYTYLVSTYITIWIGDRSLPAVNPSWTTTAIGTLQQNACIDGDHTLVALVRLSLLFSDISTAVNGTNEQTFGMGPSILSNLRQRYRELHDEIAIAPVAIKGSKVMQLQLLFVDIFLDCGSLLTLPISKTDLPTKTYRFPPPLSTLCSSAKKLHALLLLCLGEHENSSLLSFTINDWTRLIVVLTLAFRMSFPLSSCPEFDSSWARSEIRLDQFLSHVSNQTTETSSSGVNDIISASQAVLGVLKTKFDRRLALLGESILPTSPLMNRICGCPMMDADFRLSMQQLDPDLEGLSWFSAASSEEGGLLQFHDIWAASTTMNCGINGDDADFPWSSSDAAPDSCL